MQKLFKPYWLLSVITFPQSIIFFIFWRIYQVISSELSSSNINSWLAFGIGLGLLVLLYTGYSVYLIMNSKNIHPATGVAIFLTYIPFGILFFIQSGSIVPPSIPEWMIFEINPALCVLTLIMPALAYAMIISVFWLTPNIERYSFKKDIVIMVAVPAFWYMVFTVSVAVSVSIFRGTLFGLGGHVFTILFVILFVISAVAFLFLVTRVICMLLLKKPGKWRKIIVSLIVIFPLLGLIVNQACDNLFGDFSHYWFYILAAVTGVLMVIPAFDDKRIRMILYIARSVTISYTLYFFLVFLPYLPLAVMAVAFIGLGVLMLAPLLLMLIHSGTLWEDYNYLLKHFEKKILIAVFVLGVLVLPSSIVMNYLNDRSNLDKALNYVYSQNLSDNKKIDLDTKSIKRVIENIRSNKDGSGRSSVFENGGFSNSTPYISPLYNWIVLDNLTLSDDKMDKLEVIFLGRESDRNNTSSNGRAGVERGVKVDKYSVETMYEPEHGFYRSWIHLELINEAFFMAEFSTVFDMPEGSYISNYYLDVLGERKYGLITDKRAAKWIYQQIVAVRRDPGILYYLSDDRVAFKVFPFAADELRKTGFELIHRSPVKLTFEGNEIQLGSRGELENEGTSGKVIEINENIVFVPAEAKKSLPKVSRNPKYYFVVDSSKGSKGKANKYIERIEKFVQKESIDTSNAEVVAFNFEEKRAKLNGNWKKDVKDFSSKGGFFLELAVKRIIFESYKEKSMNYPVIIVVTDNMDSAVFVSDLSSMRFACPESEYFYRLNDEGNLYAYSMNEGVKEGREELVESIAGSSVVAWPGLDNALAFLPDDRDSIVLKHDDIDVNDRNFVKSDYYNAILLDALNMSLGLHPEKYDHKALGIVKGSIEHRIMTPLTSFIVLETEAQEKALLEKQKKLLSSNSHFDTMERTEMSEPSLVIIGILVLGYLAVKKRSRLKEFMSS